ncbi:MAG: metal-sulfur cluster assembly factor [Burkholderiales bacterium]|nr:metal-sulfur cluster assembly factor [Burkholderiales bacterium]
MTETEVRDALRGVIDPEIGESIVDLGLIERIEIDEAATPPRIGLMLIMTSATCPMTDVIMDDAAAALEKRWPTHDVDIAADLTIPWSPQRMTTDLRIRFGW